jgi:proton glutamate symport protein
VSALVLAGGAAVLWAIGHYGGVSIPWAVPLASRGAAVLAFCGYAWMRRSLTAWIFAGMLVGGFVGHSWPQAAANLQILSRVFLRLITTIVAPLIFSTLVVGIAGHSNLRQVGRMGIKALIYFEVVTTLALFIGLGAINLSQAGAGIEQSASDSSPRPPAQPQKWNDIILHVFPENLAKSVAEGQILQVVVFSIIFASALAMVREEKRRPVLAFCESLSEVMFKFTNIVMLCAPLGVAGAIAYTVGTMGFGVIVNLLKLVVTLYAALTVFLLCVLLPVVLFARLPLKRFIQAVTEPVSIAFATASSEAALPRALEAMEAFGVPRQIVAFVLPTGYSFNLDGSTLYLSLAAIFVTQAAGSHLNLGEQLVMMLTLMLASKGLAGVPGSVIVVLFATADSLHLPAWPVAVIFGIDRLMDMGRTATNVLGNCLASAVIARWEGELNTEAPVNTALQAIEQVEENA